MLLLAAGTGIAPMVQVLRHITSMEEDYTMVRLLFGTAKYRDIYLKDELDELKHFWNVSILYCLSDVSSVKLALLSCQTIWNCKWIGTC